ncbi:EAL domain-containing protein [Pseudomonas lalucatii]|uniref:EAL domain-containing protein n=1 Tax=Pseudomonas lalucatii TaxID=1424203 RepID=A0ABS5Q0H2_9PSED|nr:EAL domain-containing protein [Pseudomonas lalucatii]MBS7662273.1 EAL domain-containing protein [Pseudomonas lalucatii]
MKSHTDAASLLAAEAVMQLPVPARLGLLRFERLNEASWTLLFLDPDCEQRLGIAASELCALIDAPYASLMEPEARHRQHDAIQQQLARHSRYLVHYTLHTPRGPLRLTELGEPFKQRQRQLLRGYLLVAEDEAAPHLLPTLDGLAPLEQPPAGRLSEPRPRHAVGALHLFQRAVEQSASAFILLDRDGLVEYVNPSFTAITQYSAEEVQGRRLSELPALENLGELLFDAHSGLAEQNNWQGEFKSRRKNFEPYWSQLSLSKVHGEDGRLTHYIGIYEDITANKQAQQRIERLAFSDNLTGLGNRYAFIRALEERFALAEGKPLSLLLVDIDNFKRINDSLGHQTGDKLLSSLARRLRNSLAPTSVLARFASNEFAILLEGLGVEEGQRIALQVLQTLDKPLFVDNQLISVTASVGLACAPQHGRDPQTLMKHAGLALHKAKANGKHQLQLFTEALNAEADYKLFVESNLRRALTQNELEVYYQPKLCLKSGQLLGLEALLRWQHPEKGMIRPDQFIAVAEETGLIIPIGKWVARQACRMSKQLSTLGIGALQVAINLSPKQFSDPDLVGSIAAILEEEQLPPALLELELTEGLLLEASEDTRDQLNRLKSLGLTLAMDDFGTGYSSLSYLKKFPIDVIKIDRSFIKDIPENQDDMEITSAVVAMAHNLKLKVVAEGIETAAQLGFLRRQQCDIGQGYLFDRPIAGRELVERLKRYPTRPPA